MVKIYIEKIPTLNIIRSVFELEYPLEMLGYLYGERKNHNGYVNYFVENAQSAKNTKIRTDGEIENTERSHKALCIGAPSLEDLIGDYHSHTNNDFTLQSDDLEDLMEDPYYISLLIKLNKTNRKRSLKIYNNEIFGTIHFDENRYLLHVKGYYTYGKSKRIADIRFPKNVLKELFE